MSNNIKILIIRKRIWLYTAGVLILVIGFYSYFSPEECTYDIWKIIASISETLSNSNIPSKWNHFLLTGIFLLIPLLITYSISMLIFPTQPWNVLNKIGKKRKNTAKLCYTLLESQLEDVSQKIEDLNKGIRVNQNEANRIMEKVLPIIPNKEWYVTSLLEPNEIIQDENHKNSIEYTITNAKEKGLKLTRFLISEDVSTLKVQLPVFGTPINKLSRLHTDSGFNLYVIDKEKFKLCFRSCGIDEEYLDFLFVKNEVVYGLKNNIEDFKTITKNETYFMFVKDSPNDLHKYNKLIEKLLLDDNHVSPPN